MNFRGAKDHLQTPNLLLSSTELLTRGSQHMHPFLGHRWTQTSPSILINSRTKDRSGTQEKRWGLKCNREDCVSVVWILQLLRVVQTGRGSGEVLGGKAEQGERWGDERTTFGDFLCPQNSPGICSWNCWEAGRTIHVLQRENRGSEGLILQHTVQKRQSQSRPMEASGHLSIPSSPQIGWWLPTG